jgi:hypothetical protein
MIGYDGFHPSEDKMKKVLALFVAIGFFLSGSHAVFAFSTEQVPSQTNNGSSKFADPDEATPNFVMHPAEGQSGFELMPLTQGTVTLPSLGEVDEGASAFNQAYSHLQQNR